MVAPAGISEEEKQALVDLVAETVQTPEWQEAIDRNMWVPRSNSARARIEGAL